MSLDNLRLLKFKIINKRDRMKKFIYMIGLLSIVLFTGCSTKQQNQAVVSINDKEGLVKNSGEITIKPIYKSLSKFEDKNFTYLHPNHFNVHWIENNYEVSYALISNDENKFGIINKEGEILIKPIYDSIGRFYNGFAKIELNKKFGLINEDFEVVVKPIYDEALEFVYNTIIVKKFGKYGCIDKNLELKIKPTLDMIYIQEEGFKRIEENNKWGLLDNYCNIIVKPTYDYISNFQNGFAKVKSENQWGFLDTKGNLFFKPRFTKVEKF